MSSCMNPEMVLDKPGPLHSGTIPVMENEIKRAHGRGRVFFDGYDPSTVTLEPSAVEVEPFYNGYDLRSLARLFDSDMARDNGDYLSPRSSGTSSAHGDNAVTAPTRGSKGASGTARWISVGHVSIKSRNGVPHGASKLLILILQGKIGYAKQHNENGRSVEPWLFYFMVDGRPVQGYDPMKQLGDDGHGGSFYHAMAWACSRNRIGYEIDDTVFMVDDACYKYDGTSITITDTDKTPLVAVSKPSDMDKRVAMLREMWSDVSGAAFDFIATMAFYLAAPVPFKNFVIWSDDGGTGKSSFCKAFCKTFSPIATNALQLNSLTANDGFSSGSALTVLKGKMAAFCDEPRKITSREMRIIAALSTGVERQIRYGGGKIGWGYFHLKMAFLTNESHNLDVNREFVSRRLIEIPMVEPKPSSWFTAECTASSDRPLTRWDYLFDGCEQGSSVDYRKTVDALFIEGMRLWCENNGWPALPGNAVLHESHDDMQAESKALADDVVDSVLKLLDNCVIANGSHVLSLVSDAGGLYPVKWISFPLPDAVDKVYLDHTTMFDESVDTHNGNVYPFETDRKRKTDIRKMALNDFGIGSKIVRVNDRSVRCVAVTSMQKFQRFCTTHDVNMNDIIK